MKPIVESYELVDLGIENSSCFQGFGTAFTNYDHCAVGVGSNPKEAINDAIECMAQASDCDIEEFERRLCADEGWATLKDAPTTPAVEYSDDDDLECSMCDAYYYVGLRWREGVDYGGWELAQNDRVMQDNGHITGGEFFWVNEDGREIGPFNTDTEAMANKPY